jgi:hypothetical protein
VRNSGIAALTIGILVVVGVLNAVDLWRSREDRIRDGEQRAATLSLVLAEYITGAFGAADTALRQLALRSQWGLAAHRHRSPNGDPSSRPPNPRSPASVLCRCPTPTALSGIRRVPTS